MRRHRGAVATVAFMLAGACGDSSTGPEVPPLALLPLVLPAHIGVHAAVVPDSTGVATVWLVLTNPSASTDSIVYGVCAAAALLYPEGSEQAVWQSAPPPGPTACAPDYAVLLVLPPSATRSILAGRLSASGLIGQPPAGRYVAAAAFRDGTAIRLLRAGPVVCTALGCAA